MIRSRLTLESTPSVRLAEAFEYLALLGFPPQLLVPRPAGSIADPHDFVALFGNLAGNAWTAFHYAPWVMSLLATEGAFQGGVPAEAADDKKEMGTHSTTAASSGLAREHPPVPVAVASLAQSFDTRFSDDEPLDASASSDSSAGEDSDLLGSDAS